jgi:hypothetical protein
VYQGAFEPTKMCGSGPTFGSSANSPSGMNTWSADSGAPGSIEPQRPQNGRAPPAEDAYMRIRSVPRSQRKPVFWAAPKLANGEPCDLRHIEQ